MLSSADADAADIIPLDKNVAYPTSMRRAPRAQTGTESQEELEYYEVMDSADRIITNSDSDHDYEDPVN